MSDTSAPHRKVINIADSMVSSENVNRKTIIKSLQDEIASLHVELLEIRHANVLLQAKVKRNRDDPSGLGGKVRLIFL